MSWPQGSGADCRPRSQESSMEPSDGLFFLTSTAIQVQRALYKVEMAQG